MRKMKWMAVLVLWLGTPNVFAQTGRPLVDTEDAAPLDA